MKVLPSKIMEFIDWKATIILVNFLLLSCIATVCVNLYNNLSNNTKILRVAPSTHTYMSDRMFSHISKEVLLFYTLEKELRVYEKEHTSYELTQLANSFKRGAERLDQKLYEADMGREW